MSNEPEREIIATKTTYCVEIVLGHSWFVDNFFLTTDRCGLRSFRTLSSCLSLSTFHRQAGQLCGFNWQISGFSQQCHLKLSRYILNARFATKSSSEIRRRFCVSCLTEYHSACTKELAKKPDRAFRWCCDPDYIHTSLSTSQANRSAAADQSGSASQAAGSATTAPKSSPLPSASSDVPLKNYIDQALELMRGKLETSFKDIITESIAELKTDVYQRLNSRKRAYLPWRTLQKQLPIT